MKILVINGLIAYVVASTHTTKEKRPFRPIANLVGEARNETVDVGDAFSRAPIGITQSDYDSSRRLLRRGVRAIGYEIIKRNDLSEYDQVKLLADLWTGKPVEGFP